ncbi:MAG: CHRD domain-containing protein [Luteibaculum sp.]
MRIFTLIFSFITILSYTLHSQDLSERLLFSAKLDGDNNTSVVNPDAQGIALFHLNATRDSLFVNIAVTNLNAELESVQIHEGVSGEDGPPVMVLDSAVFRNKVNTVITDSLLADLLPRMFEGELYVNAYSENFPIRGNARGQITLERDFSFFTNLDTIQTVPQSESSNAFASANFKLDQNADSLQVKLATVGLEEEITGIHLHRGVEGETGPVIVDLTPLLQEELRIDSLIALPDSLSSVMKQYVENGEIYLNIHTSSNPAGEIRGQALSSTDLYFDFYAEDENATQNPLFTSNVAMAGHAYLNSTFDTLRYFFVYELDSLSADPLTTSFNLNGVPAKILTADSGRISGVWTASDPTQPLNAAAITGLLQNQVSIQISTTLNPAGELSGIGERALRDAYVFDLDTNQVVSLVTVNELPLGAGMITVNTRGTNAHYMMAWDNLSGETLQNTISAGLPDETGPQLFDLNNENNGAFGYLTTNEGFNASAVDLFNRDSAYVRVSTMQNPNAELRGNLNRNYRETQTTSIRKNGDLLAGLRMVPNPAGDVVDLQLQSKSNTLASITIFDRIGKRVFSVNTSLRQGNNIVKLDLSGLERGYYLLNVNANSSVVSDKFIKQ